MDLPSVMLLAPEGIEPEAGEPAAKRSVITFYSYKGGTGRSMALVNLAWTLALNDQRVLVIDWDLEAPGLHRFFQPFLSDGELLEQPGLLDFVERLAIHSAVDTTPAARGQADVFDYIVPLDWPLDALSGLCWRYFGLRAGIDLLGAGRQGPAYSTKLASFNWVDFYERLGGRGMLAAAFERLKDSYDYVLIDSRTGVSDTSGICTVELPDTLVVCFTLNNQSIRGASSIADSVIAHWRNRTAAPATASASTAALAPAPARRILPVPMRVEITAELDKRTRGLELARQLFQPCLAQSEIVDREGYWGRLQMAYFPYYAFEEIPAVFGDPPRQDLSLSRPVKQLASVITNGEIKDVPLLADTPDASEQARREVLGWYLRSSKAKADAVQAAQRIHDALSSAERETLMLLLSRLIRFSTTGRIEPRSADLDELRGHDALVASLQELGVIEVTNVRGGRSVALRDPALAEAWAPWRDWLASNRLGVITRQAIGAGLEAWLNSGQDEGSLLRGRTLRLALSDLERLGLTADERRYVLASSAAAGRAEQVAERPVPRISLVHLAIVIGVMATLAQYLRTSIQGMGLPPSLVATGLLSPIASATYYGLLAFGLLLGSRARFLWREEELWILPAFVAMGVFASDWLALGVRSIPFVADFRSLASVITRGFWFGGITVGMLFGLRRGGRLRDLSSPGVLRILVLSIVGAFAGSACEQFAVPPLNSALEHVVGLSNTLTRSPFWMVMLAGVLAGTPHSAGLPPISRMRIFAIVSAACLAGDVPGSLVMASTYLAASGQDSALVRQLNNSMNALANGLFYGGFAVALGYCINRFLPATDAPSARRGSSDAAPETAAPSAP